MERNKGQMNKRSFYFLNPGHWFCGDLIISLWVTPMQDTGAEAGEGDAS